MFAFLFTHIFADCTETLNTKMGAYHVQKVLGKDETYCINITQYPFYIIFYKVPETVTYYEYYSRSPRRETNRDFSANGTALPAFRAIELPYGSISFEATQSAEIMFTYATLPGYCQTGIYLSSRSVDTIQLSPSSKSFYKLGNYDDKCFLFASAGEQEIKLQQTSTDPLDRVFIYSNYTSFKAFTGNISQTIKSGTDTEAPVIRVQTNKGQPPSSFELSFSSQSAASKNPSSAIHTPRGRSIDCEKVVVWYTEELVIMLITSCSFLAIVLIMICACKLAKK